MFLFYSISIAAEEIVRALSWTLLHSVWQGVLLSLIAALIMLFTKNQSPSLRYNLLSGTLVLFITGIFFTFFVQLVYPADTTQLSILTASPIDSVQPSANPITLNPGISVIDKAVGFLNANAGWIVLTWLLTIVYKFIQLSSGYYNMYQLKKKQVSSAGEYWNKRVIELCGQLRINKNVQLLQSCAINVPAVIGYFKPVILFPAAMLTAMSVQEVEAVLIHELGHIRRRDFLVNFLQNIVEIIFFFNPAVLWVSSLIKTERENCCDDIAINHTTNKKDYIKALISFQQFSQKSNQQLAVAFSGETNQLLTRVKRIIYKNNKTLNNLEKRFLSAMILLSSICLLAFVSLKAQEDKKNTKTELVSGTQNSKPDSKIEVLPVKDTLPKTTVDTIGKDTVQHNPTDENASTFSNRTGIQFRDDSLIAYVNEKVISKIDRKKSKQELRDWLAKYAPITGVDPNSIDGNNHVNPTPQFHRVQRIKSVQPELAVQPVQSVEPTQLAEAIESIKESSANGEPVLGFTGIEIIKDRAIAYKNDIEISRITSNNSKAEIEAWREKIEKILHHKFPSIQQLIDNKKE